MGIFKRPKDDIINQWGPRLFLEFTAQEIYGDGPVVAYYTKVSSSKAEIWALKTFGKPDVQQTLMNLHQQVMRELAFPLVISKESNQEEALFSFAAALLHATAHTITGNSNRVDPTGFEMGLCVVIGESLCRCAALKMRDKYGDVVGDGLVTLAAWMLSHDNQHLEN